MALMLMDAGYAGLAKHEDCRVHRQYAGDGNMTTSYYDMILQRPRWLLSALAAMALTAVAILVLSASGSHRPPELSQAWVSGSNSAIYLQKSSSEHGQYVDGGATASNRPVPLRPGQIYQVKRGDTVWGIAVSLDRGSMSKASKIASELEKEAGGNTLFPGESIRIPSG
ncbi:MAG: LysM domain-containing protein [Actinobacteria bacterium]|nr:LysM domain-containing protein [Actinomycetota bacterium]MCL5446070.1 LysM domain-containing protein [Actinomycetota bacterium]